MSSHSINELLESLKEEFLATISERLSNIESIVLNLTEGADVEDLLRIVHSLKGAAGTHGFHIFTKICHQMEDMMRDLIDSNNIHNQAAVKILLEYNDLQNMALDIINRGGDDFHSIDSKLNQINSIVGSDQKKVLIVEPSPLYASLITSVIESEDCQVKIVNDGFIALENLLMQQYDVVITAMEVPTLNGDALISAVRLSRSKNKNITAILVTTKSADNIEHVDIFNHIVNRNAIKDGLLIKLINS